MEIRVKNLKRDMLYQTRSSFGYCPENRKSMDSQVKVVSITSRGNDTTRIFEESLKPIIKKSASHCSMDIQKLFKKTSSRAGILQDSSKLFKTINVPKRLSLHCKLPPSPVIIPQGPTRFLISYTKLESKLNNFYLNAVD